MVKNNEKSQVFKGRDETLTEPLRELCKASDRRELARAVGCRELLIERFALRVEQTVKDVDGKGRKRLSEGVNSRVAGALMRHFDLELFGVPEKPGDAVKAILRALSRFNKTQALQIWQQVEMKMKVGQGLRVSVNSVGASSGSDDPGRVIRYD